MANPRSRSGASRRLLIGFSLIAALGLTAAACADENGPDLDDDAADNLEEQDEVQADVEEVDESAFYYDKTIEVIVPFGPGGGSDTQARFLAPFMSEHFSGNPTVVPFNIAGASGTIANNQFALQRDPELATSILFSGASSFLTWVFGEPALRLDYANLVGLAAIQTGGLVYANADTGLESASDLANYDGQLIAGEQTVNSLALLPLLAYDMLGLDVQVVFGYEGRGPARVAFEQGETNLNWDTTASVIDAVNPLIDEGVAVPMFSFGQMDGDDLVGDPVLDNVPTFLEVYVDIHGEEPSGPKWEAYKTLVRAGLSYQGVMWLQNDAPAEAIEQARAGFDSLANDPEFQVQAGDIIGAYAVVTGDDVAGAVESVVSVDEESRNWIIDYMVENFDHPDPRS